MASGQCVVRVWLVCCQDVDAMQKRTEGGAFFCAIYIKVRDVKIRDRIRKKKTFVLQLPHFHTGLDAKQDSYCKEDYKPIRATELKHATRFSGTF